MAKRKPRVIYKWRAVTRAERSNIKPHTLAGKRIVEYVCDWSLYGANGEFIVGSHPQGFQDKTDAYRSVCAVVRALTDRTMSIPIPFKEEGPGKKPMTDAEIEAAMAAQLQRSLSK